MFMKYSSQEARDMPAVYNVGMEAGMLSCPSCGAPAGTNDLRCSFCGVQLATVRCAACMAACFVGAAHCAKCGAALTAMTPMVPPGERKCPHCKTVLAVMALGEAILEECRGCGGVWVDAESFRRLCEDKAEQAAYAGMGSPLVAPAHAPRTGPVSYVPCPDCQKLMQRINFARCSGVIVDVCKGHGTWFDRDELGQIIEFVRKGGLDAARASEREHLELEQRRLKERQLASASEGVAYTPDEISPALAAAGGLLKILLG
jgi:Zn-finger nucleic acid-binding protein